MNKLHQITLATVLSILGLNAIAIANAEASIKGSQFISSTKSDRYLIAQKSGKTNKSSQTEDEMIEELQKRDKKIEAFKDMLKIDGILPETESTDEEAIDTGDDMMDALQRRQQKIERLKELKQAQDKLNERKIADLQAQGINVENVQELREIRKLVNNPGLDSEKILETLQNRGINIDSIQKLETIRNIVNAGNSVPQSSDSDKLSATTAFRMFTIGIPATILVFLIGKPIVKGIAGTFKSNYSKKFGKPSIPERSLNLHNNSLKEIIRVGNKAEKINDEKFSSDEFKTLILYKIDVARGLEGYKELNYKVELLRAAIIAQKSFLKLESTELRYRSRRQQQFYQYIADNLSENIDKEAFTKKVKEKQAELLPLINTEQGREAIHAYAKEINDIGKHELGLKLLALFKKYDLKDFSIIRDISEIVEGIPGHNLLEPKKLIFTVKEYYDVFEKIAPILELSQEESSASTYARILQIVGLMYRHGDSYEQFKELIRLLRKWEQLNETITMVREQFNSREYSIPPEFKKEIPGKSAYEQYADYLKDLA